MADYPFNLRGTQERFNGPGQRGGETYKSREFTLKPGIVYAEIEHHGHGDFTLEFVPAEGFTRGQATTAAFGGSLATGAASGMATGAAIGSIVPGAGTIVGAAIGGAIGWFAGGKVGTAIDNAMQRSPPSGLQWQAKADTTSLTSSGSRKTSATPCRPANIAWK